MLLVSDQQAAVVGHHVGDCDHERDQYRDRHTGFRCGSDQRRDECQAVADGVRQQRAACDPVATEPALLVPGLPVSLEEEVPRPGG